MTYSIVARDSQTGCFGIAIQSHFLAAASVASFAEAGIGAIASQAFASRQYGVLGMDMLRAGLSARSVLDALLQLDVGRDVRQVGIVDAAGRVAGFTGDRCVVHAEHRSEAGVVALGNMLAAPGFSDAMLAAYLASDDDFAGRLLAALDAAEAAGGDARGRQSAGLLVVEAERSAQPWHAVLHDERVDDHEWPLVELRRLVGLKRAYRNIGGILFDEGPLFTPVDRTDSSAVEAALTALRESAAAGGEAAQEAALWQAVLLARFGRLDEARALVPSLLDRQPKLAIFLTGLGKAGFLPPEIVTALLPEGR
jgi:uncharacterized Ntn-hydrolase superfamily protein